MCIRDRECIYTNCRGCTQRYRGRTWHRYTAHSQHTRCQRMGGLLNPRRAPGQDSPTPPPRHENPLEHSPDKSERHQGLIAISARTFNWRQFVANACSTLPTGSLQSTVAWYAVGMKECWHRILRHLSREQVFNVSRLLALPCRRESGPGCCW